MARRARWDVYLHVAYQGLDGARTACASNWTTSVANSLVAWLDDWPHRLAVSCYEQGKVKMQLVLPAATNAHQLPWQYALEDGAIR